MKPNLDISIFQIDLAYKDKSKNYNTIDLLAEKINETDVILLPEMFNTSFIPSDITLAEEMSGTTVNWMKSLSKRKNASVAGTLMIKENNLYYNRLVWVSKNGDIYTYDKCHLFSLAKEDRALTKGNKKIIIKENGWSICPLICYDIRFPVFCRNKDEYDILIFLSSWPEKRISAWDTLLKARAIENQCFTIGVNRVGEDLSGVLFPGHSLVYDSFGKILLDCSGKKNTVKKVVLSKEKLLLQRRQMNFLKDRDLFTIN